MPLMLLHDNNNNNNKILDMLLLFFSKIKACLGMPIKPFKKYEGKFFGEIPYDYQ